MQEKRRSRSRSFLFSIAHDTSTHIPLSMNQTSETLGQGDFEAVPEQDVASLLPRTMGQTSLLHNMNDTEPDATLTNLDQTSSSSSTLTLMPSSTTILADPVVYRYELDQLRLQVKRFIPDDVSPVLISTNMAKKIISHGLLALNHPNVISATIAIVTVLEQRHEIPAADVGAFLNAMLSIDQVKAAFDEARSAPSIVNLSSLFVEE